MDAVVGRRKKTEAELVQEFWIDAGFPTLTSRFWERRPSTSSEPRESSCRSPKDVADVGAPGRPRLSPRSVTEATACRRSPSSPTGLRLPRPSRMGPWRGPLPPRRITPPPVLG